MNATTPLCEDVYHAYCQTLYQVTLPTRAFTLRVGVRHPAFDEALRDHHTQTWGFITAANPRSEITAAPLNQARHAQLCAVIKEAGYPMFPGWGIPQNNDWDPEQSLCIFGIQSENLRKLGIQFEQNAVVFGALAHPAQFLWCLATPPSTHTA